MSAIHIEATTFWLCVFVAALIVIVVWRLPKGTKPHGLAKAWRWITVGTALYFAYFSYPVLPYFLVLTPLLYLVFLLLMAATVVSAARQNCKPVWIRTLAGLLLNLAISIDLMIMYP